MLNSYGLSDLSFLTQRTVLYVAVLVLSLGGLAGCVPLVVGGAAAGGYYAGKDDRPVGQIIDDTGIELSIKASYATDSDISVWDIKVDSHDGVVKLFGTVPSREVGRKAVKLAEEVRGVNDVVDNLTVDSN
jgi:hyperosmotically inducible protein